MIVKDHGQILCIVDDDLLGKVFEEGIAILDLCSPFFQGEPASEQEILALLPRSIIVAIGKDSIALLKKKIDLEDRDVLFVQNIPHVQIVL
ncbi:MAG: DUF424 family protein [archaeon]